VVLISRRSGVSRVATGRALATELGERLRGRF